MNKLLESLKKENNFTYTENGALTHTSTLNKVLDMFALGGAYRSRSEEDIILLFKEAYEENPELALKCLFYLRDIVSGQGERRFFRTAYKWLGKYHSETAKVNLHNVYKFGRWDDLYCLVNTPVERAMFKVMCDQLLTDLTSNNVSLCAKWVKSINTSSEESRYLAEKTRQAFGLTCAQYRIMLSTLRERIRIVETLMSQNRWNEIEFDKIPSGAGLKYRKAFARNDVIGEKYAKFAQNENTKVNAGTLYPYQVVEKAIEFSDYNNDETNRLMINKYWDNLTDYFNGAKLDALCMIDTSGSMYGTPINVAISLGLYCAERNKGPWHNHYISFSSRPQLIETRGTDFCDKVRRIYQTNLCENTNIEAAFDMILNTAIRYRAELPENVIVISDMEFDSATGYYPRNKETLMERIARKFENAGYKCPHLIYWNVDARQNNIPMIGHGRISYVSGFSPVIFQTIMSGKSGEELMLEKLNSERYSSIEIKD